MSLRDCLPLVPILVLAAAERPHTQAGPSPKVWDPVLDAFVPAVEQATRGFMNGDPAQWLRQASRRDDATIMGAWGAHERGWDAVGPRYDWAATRFQPSDASLRVEYVASGVSGDLAYTVAIERARVRLTGEASPADMALRVTHIFRKEEGAWKLLHRHADPLVEKTAPATVLKK